MGECLLFSAVTNILLFPDPDSAPALYSEETSVEVRCRAPFLVAQMLLLLSCLPPPVETGMFRLCSWDHEHSSFLVNAFLMFRMALSVLTPTLPLVYSTISRSAFIVVRMSSSYRS